MDIFIADTVFKRLLGYMFRKKPHHDAILFVPCNSIHTFFMKFNIDVLFINKNFVVIKKIENLGSGKVIMPVLDAKLVMEAKSGNFKNISIGEKIDLNVYKVKN